MEILYKVHNNLYVNLTNKCPYSCTFCLRQTMDRIGESGRLWLEREPSYDEVIAEFEMFLSRLLSMLRKHMAKRQESILTELEILLMAETLCQRWKA